MNAEIMAYMAGLIDGEGALIIEYNDNDRARPSFYPRISMSQKDKRLLNWVIKHFGGVINEHPSNGCFQWQCPVDRILPILEGCLPYLIIKKRKAVLMIALRKSILDWKLKRFQTGIPNAIAVPDNIYSFREEIYREFQQDDPDAIFSPLAGATTERIDSLRRIRNQAQKDMYKEMRQSGLNTIKVESSAEMTEPAHIS